MCLNPKNNKVTNQKHITETKYQITSCPEVIMLNLQWNGEPLPESILKILVSIPQTFDLKDLYTIVKQ